MNIIKRDLDNRRRKIDDSRRSVNEKAEQLKAVGYILFKDIHAIDLYFSQFNLTTRKPICLNSWF
jgi:ABC-type Zn2+ transport system substrate-binding protein/surface adhesin